MSELSRRTWLKQMAKAAAAGAAASSFGERLFAQQNGSQLTGRENGEIGRIASGFKTQFSIPGLSLAYSANGQFVLDRQFGIADEDKEIQVDQSSLFRIASVTKPITAVAIFSLIENGKLNLNDKVFGPSGVLGTKYGSPPYKQYVADITVDNLLTHTSGGWPNDSTDPMFQHNGWDQTKLITWTIATLSLSYPPGEHWAYSNFGYCVLGRVIEAVTGQTYADYVKANILAPCGISDMDVAQNSERHRAANEVIYYGQYTEDPYKINVTRMDSNGGWIATPTDLVQFLNHVAGAPGVPALLKPGTIRTMVTPSAAYPGSSPAKYARGWMVRDNGRGNWWHNGSLPGSTAIMVRTAGGMCWAGLANSRTEPTNEIDLALDTMMWNIVSAVPSWNP
ncbi:MAG TPA: serine hydrolase domain-containing protein [Candidatus Acidoferrum sp.]|nr:serine hydrolase domain-containing protein [Candidatus Acidoferrum sp.]